MNALDWILTVTLFVVYIALLVTVCTLTFQKGYIALGIVGIFMPLLWLIGALLPAKQGSPYQRKEAARLRMLEQTGGLEQSGGMAGT